MTKFCYLNSCCLHSCYFLSSKRLVSNSRIMSSNHLPPLPLPFPLSLQAGTLRVYHVSSRNDAFNINSSFSNVCSFSVFVTLSRISLCLLLIKDKSYHYAQKKKKKKINHTTNHRRLLLPENSQVPEKLMEKWESGF